jgi:hypothetical protein
MLNRNARLVAFTVAVITILIVASILPASAQLSQWRSLNPTRDGTSTPTIRKAPAPFLYDVQMLTPNYGWAVGGTCETYTDDPSYTTYGCSSTNYGAGFTLFWDGSRWRQTLVPASAATLTSVYIVAANDVWAVGVGGVFGYNTIIHWDGVSWVAVPPLGFAMDLYSVFMLPGGMDGWAVGYDVSLSIAVILRWSGTWPTGAWSVFTTTPSLTGVVLRGVFLSSPTQGWAVGTSGTILRWDGAGWMKVTPPTLSDLYSVFALSGTDAWAVGARGTGGAGTIIRWNGASWTGPMVAPTTNVDYRSIKMVRSDYGWIAGSLDPTSKEGTLLDWNGVAWTIVRSWVTVGLNGLFLLPGGVAGSVVGDAETITHWNGSVWFAQTSPTFVDLNAVSMVSANDGWAIGKNGTIFRYDGNSWSHYETLPSGVNLYGLHMRTSTDGWAVGAALSVNFPPAILRWDGTAWTSITPSGVALNQTLYAVDILSASEAWAVGNGTKTPATMLKWDGSIWTSVPSGTPVNATLFGIDMLSPTDGWAVGCDQSFAPIIVRWNGLAWSQVTPPAGAAGLYDVFMLSSTDGWAVGNWTSSGQATIIHWDGMQWRSVPGPDVGGYGFLHSVHMISPTDGWAVGYYNIKSSVLSEIVHWDGMTWNIVATLALPPTMAVPLRSVFMVDALDGWVVSDQGLILHYGPESVPGTTTSMSTVIQTTTSTTITTTTSSTFTTPSSTTAPSTWGVPGYPIESILAGLIGGLIALTVIRRRRRL